MRYLVTLQAANGRETTVPVDARTMEGASSRAERRHNRAEPLDDSGKRHAWRTRCVIVAPFGWTR